MPPRADLGVAAADMREFAAENANAGHFSQSEKYELELVMILSTNNTLFQKQNDYVNHSTNFLI
jgi:hypothetical protein